MFCFTTVSKRAWHKRTLAPVGFVNLNAASGNCNTENESDLFIKETSKFLPGMTAERISTTYSNRLGQVRKKVWTSQFGDKISTQVQCYEPGTDGVENVVKSSIPRFSSDLIRIQEVHSDYLGRIRYQEFDDQNTSFSYSSLATEDGQVSTASSNFTGERSSTTDLTGIIVKRTDAGGDLSYTFDSGGLPKTVTLNEETIVENTYDDFGRQLVLDDKYASGATNYTYDSFDRIITQSDANGVTHTNTYDAFDQLEVRDVSIDDQSIGSYSYNYYTTGPNKHRLENETAPSGHETNYAYDNEGNITTIDEVIDGESIETTYEYDEKGKPTRKIYPSGFAIRYVYDEKEYLKKIVSDDNSLIIWEVNHINAQNKLTNYTLGNGLTVDYDYNDEYFYPESYQVTAGSDEVISFDYTFDEVTGNLKMRNLGSSNEYFFYDENGLNRLIGAGPAEDEIEEEYTIAPNGNILEKENVGVYSYHEIKKFAVSKIELNGGIEEADLTYITGIQSITYNHFNSAASITNSDDQIRLDIEYGPDNQRRIGKYYDISGQNDVWLKSRIYAGSYERQEDAIGNEIEVHYISAGDHLVALYVIENGDAKYFYPHLDHLGSILYITDESGNLLEDDYGNIVSQSFDAWGRPRNPDDLSYEDIPEIPSWLWRGYTGHEHLDEFGLVNMNGRLYDPVVGRMLSPDNYVQSPDFSQSYNRYSYVWNNPLKYNDPSGEFVQYIIGAVLGGINGYLTGKSAGLEGGALFLSTIAGAGIGLATAGVGTIVSNSSGVLAAGMVGGYVNGAGNGLLTSVANGQDFDATISNTFMSAGKGAISGAAGGVVGGAIGGGSGAFFGGATSGALGTAMNGGSKDDVLRGAIVGGAASFGAYHINGMVAYSKYEKSGVTFDGNKLYYKQFMGMGADFQRSRFYKREHGGMLLSDGTIDRSAVLLRGKDYILWDPEGAKVGTWGYYHAHHGEPGTPAPNGGFWLPHHSPDDMMGTYSTNLESLVINPSNTYYKPSSYNPSNLTNTSGLSNYNLGLQRSFTFPYFGFW